MKFSISKKSLINVVQKSLPVIPNVTSLNVLHNFKMIFSSNKLEVIASDLDNFVKATTDITGDGEVEIAVNAKKMFEVVKEIGDELLTLEVINNSLTINSESGFTCKITGVNIKDFPNFPDSKYGDTYSIPSSVFNSLVEKSNFAVSRDEARACLCGVLWECSSQRVGMVATDGHRLGASFSYTELGFENDTSVIVPNKSLQHILKTIEFGNFENVDFTISDRNIVFSVDGFTLSAKLIDGPYPDYEKGIPNEFSKSVIIDRKNLISAIKRVSVLSNKKTGLVKFNFEDNNINICANNREIGGEANQIIPVKYDGEDNFLIGFNGTYLLEILNIIKTQDIKINMNGQFSATVISEVLETENNDSLFLVMPLRIFD